MISTAVLICAVNAVSAAEYLTPHMPWGEPDLQGTWTSATVTLLERPDEFDTLVLSEEQAAAAENSSAEFLDSIDDVGDSDLSAGDDVGGYNSFWLDPGTRMLRVKGQARSSIIVEPDDGEVPYTLLGKGKLYWALFQSQQRNNPEQQLLGERCMVGFGSVGGPPMLPVLYNNNYQITQSPGVVMIMIEMNHNVRTIPIGGTPLPAQIRPWMGDSTGHWEGETLVVKTRQFHLQQSLRAAIKHQLLMTPDSVVVERFTRLGEKEINYTFSVEDEDLYTQIWRGELTLRATDSQIYEYACHEGNYAMPGILAGARKEEQE